MKIYKREFEDLCNIHKMDAGTDPVASWRKIQEYYCSQLSSDVCPIMCFNCIDTIEAILQMQNSGALEEKLVEYASNMAKQMTEKYNKIEHKNPYDNEHPSPLTYALQSLREEREKELKKKP